MLGWSGDMTLGSSYGHPPSGGAQLFNAVSALLKQPDLMIGNYEGTLSYGGRSRCSGGALCFIFQAPPSRAKVLARAGYDVMNLANNHALDKGISGRNQTVSALGKVGIPTAGIPNRVTVMQVEDTKVAIVGISPYPGMLPMTRAVVRSQVHAARRQGDVVVVLMHAGLEGARGAHVPRGNDYNTQTRSVTHAAIDAGADVVFGSGPHVVRGVERYRGRYIIYSTGNFAGWHNFALNALTSQSGIVHLTIGHDGVATRAQWHGVRLRGPGIPVRDTSVVRRVAALSRADFGRRGARFGREGTFR
jgi:poly-gamma-glutamate capsule biosynthesis protein CapA/YwtB (metallophosphatase superfamily)